MCIGTWWEVRKFLALSLCTIHHYFSLNSGCSMGHLSKSFAKWNNTNVVMNQIYLFRPLIKCWSGSFFSSQHTLSSLWITGNRVLLLNWYPANHRTVQWLGEDAVCIYSSSSFFLPLCHPFARLLPDCCCRSSKHEMQKALSKSLFVQGNKVAPLKLQGNN